MLRWIAALFGFEPIRYPGSPSSTAPKDPQDISVDKMWPEGSQARKEVRFSEPAGWDHTNWPWRSIGLVNRLGSLHPQVDRAECRCCLGVLKCRGCGKLVRPNTKSAEMNAQLARGCPGPACGDTLQRIPCESRIYRFVSKEDGVEYSNWEHTGHHHSHARPPVGRKPPGVHNIPDLLKPEPESSGNASRAQNIHTGNIAGPAKLKTDGVRKATFAPAPPPSAPSANAPASLTSTAAAVTRSASPEASVLAAEPAGSVVWRDEK
jgi:hypothetical protein